MKEFSISQSYLLCALNENGKLPALSTEIPACLLAGGLIDLILAKSIAIGADKKLSITSELTQENQPLASLYTFLKESKPMKLEGVTSEFLFAFSDKRMKLLIRDIGSSLAAVGSAVVEEGGLFGKTACFLPNTDDVDAIIQNIRAELLEDGTLSDQIIALVSLMEKSNQIKRYFSKYEKDQLKTRLKEIKDSDSNKLVKEMINYMETLLAVIVAASGSH